MRLRSVGLRLAPPPGSPYLIGMADDGTSELSEWNAAVGPFYSIDGTAHLLEASLDELLRMVDRGDVLALPAGPGLVFPAMQFADDRRPAAGLSQVLEVLSEGLPDPWDRALWLNSPADDAEGQTTADMLRDGSVDEVLRRAREDVARWTH